MPVSRGGGAHLEPDGLMYHGFWDPIVPLLHINNLELLAIRLTLLLVGARAHNRTVLISTDNTTVVSYIRRQGGTVSRSLSQATTELLLWCQVREIELLVRHIPGRPGGQAVSSQFSSRVGMGPQAGSR